MALPADCVACTCCGLIQRRPAGTDRLQCARCHHPLRRRHPYARHLTAALAMAGLILYPWAITLPMLQIEKLGHRNQAGVVDGCLAMWAHGDWFIAAVVLLVSVVLPLMKLLGLLTISLGGRLLRPRFKARTWHIMEWAGRWGMLDVLLVAVLVAVIKIGDLATVTAGPGALCFALLVVLNLAAAASFDPHDIWEDTAS